MPKADLINPNPTLVIRCWGGILAQRECSGLCREALRKGPFSFVSFLLGKQKKRKKAAIGLALRSAPAQPTGSLLARLGRHVCPNVDPHAQSADAQSADAQSADAQSAPTGNWAKKQWIAGEKFIL